MRGLQNVDLFFLPMWTRFWDRVYCLSALR